jgi:two-component system invasion response regulator UvrY
MRNINNGISILLVDDHTLLRKGIRQILENDPRITKIEEAASSKEVLHKINKSSFDCILLDICLPGENGLQLMKRIKCIDPDVPILILSMYPEKQYGIRSLCAGASGYITKTIPPKELKNAILTVSQGKKYVTPELAVELATETDRLSDKPLHQSLSDRELQILTLIASGRSVSQVARELHISIKTVSTHRANTLKKMGLYNNAQLIHYAVKNQLVF